MGRLPSKVWETGRGDCPNLRRDLGPGADVHGGDRPMIENVRTTTTTTKQRPPARPLRPRSRFGYDHQWWGEARGGQGRSPIVLVLDAPAASLSGVRRSDLAGLRVRRALARRRLGRGAPDRRRRLDAAGPGRARPDRPLVPALVPGAGPARLAGGRPARLAVRAGGADRDGGREPGPGRRAGRDEPAGRPGVHLPRAGSGR